jgi:transketolase
LARSELEDSYLERLRERAKFIRTETVRLIQIAKSGHFSSVFSAAEIIATLYYHTMSISKDPKWPDRDRLILSKGHAAVGVYPILADLGYFPKQWLESYAKLGSPLGDHPDMRKVPGIDFSSGSLGHGLSVGLGMALWLRLRKSPARVFVLLGDAELNEGQIWEAAEAAAHYHVDNLIGIVDRNQMGLDGRTEEIMSVEPLRDKWSAFGWQVHECDGHSVEELVRTFDNIPRSSGRPQVVIAHTVKGKGVKFMELSRVWHLGYLHGVDAESVTQELVNHDN